MKRTSGGHALKWVLLALTKPVETKLVQTAYPRERVSLLQTLR
jgi:hypothetical protein